MCILNTDTKTAQSGGATDSQYHTIVIFLELTAFNVATLLWIMLNSSEYHITMPLDIKFHKKFDT